MRYVLTCLLVLGVAAPAAAQQQAEPLDELFASPAKEEAGEEEKVEPKKRKKRKRRPVGEPHRPRVRESSNKDLTSRYQDIKESTRRQIQSGQGTVHIYQLIEEIIDDVTDDLRKLERKRITPTALNRVTLSRNLSQQFGHMVEAKLTSAVSNGTDIEIKRCVACGALRSRVDGDDWVVSLGMVEQAAYRKEAERLDVQSYLDANFAWFPGANIVVMQVEVLRAYDGAVLWAETYRSDATTAAILRSGDRAMGRGEALAELERKLEARPYYGHLIYAGASFIPYDHPAGGLSGASLGYRLYEKFGEERRWLFGVGGEVFANTSKDNPLLGSFLGMALQYELLTPNLNSVVLRTGHWLGGFFAGQEGNSFAAEWTLDLLLQFRLGFGVSAMYFRPTQYAGFDLGGFGLKGRASFNW